MHGEPIWTPSRERVAAARITAFEHWLAEERGLHFGRYEQLWQWSVDDQEAFWGALWDYFDIAAAAPYERVLARRGMPDAEWFAGARLNFVDQIFRHGRDDQTALIYESEAGGCGEVSWDRLRREVASVAATLRDLDVGQGDRVAAYLPNIAQTVIAFLATASIGAIWSVCSPELGPAGVIDRFHQIKPKVLIACDGYRFGGKAFDRRDVVAAALVRLDSVQAVLWVPHLDTEAPAPQGRPAMLWEEAVRRDETLSCAAVPFDHPLWILYSSGTTGLPKAIVHGHGGVLLNGLLSSALHTDLGPGSRFFFSSSTSWMVWNAHVMALLVGATLSLFDGAVTGPGPEPDWGHLWKLAARQRIKTFGAGAAFYGACAKAGVRPRDIADLASLDTLCATGSPLPPESYHWIYEAVKADLWLKCSAGGTDIANTFLCGTPTLPVHVGEMQCRNLGAAVFAFDEAGAPLTDEVGELVCTRPIPSMPLCFWNDPDGSRLIESYFDTYANPDGSPVWRHGDWLRLVPRSQATGGIIYGRSDATINRQGIRMGTAELYRAVEGFDQVLDSLVIDLEYLGRPSHMMLFVVLRQGMALDSDLHDAIRQAIRAGLSARHVPDQIVQMQAIPRTLTGKKMEVPLKRLMLGHEIEKVVSRDAMSNPDSLDAYIPFVLDYLASVAVGAN